MEVNFNSIYKILKNNNLDKADIGLIENNLEEIEEESIIKILSLAALLIQREEIEYQKLAYYIILKYSIITKDYSPLYEISYRLCNIPVIQLLDKINNVENEESFFEEIYDILKENCKENDKYYTRKQKKLKYDFFQGRFRNYSCCTDIFWKNRINKRIYP